MQVDRSLLLVAPIVFLAACSGFAQSAGSYSTFGKGCSGQTRDPLLFAMNLPFTGRVFTSVVSHIRPSSFGLLIIGNSDKQGAGYNLPLNLRFLGAANCNLLVSYDFTLSFVTGTGSAVIAAKIPNQVSLVGSAWFQQALTPDPQSNSQGWAFSNGAKAVIGGCPCGPPLSITEDFQSDRMLDTTVSAGKWGGGQALPPQIGGTGILGSFDVTIGRKDPADPKRFVWSSDRMTIPGSHTRTGQPIVVTNGLFEFTDFELKQGYTLAFEGSRSAQIRVQGDTLIEGTIEVDAPAPPFFLAVSTPGSPAALGQGAAPGGPGGGAGGAGGDSCQNIGANAKYDGKPGQAVRLPSGNGYTAQAAPTAGKGSKLFPVSGRNTDYCALTGVFCGVVGAGGGGGGFFAKGKDGFVTKNPCNKPLNSGTAVNSGGGSFDLGGLTNTNSGPNKSLNFYSTGGSGGGGGGSHPFLSRSFPFSKWVPGSSGAGGGGVIGFRVGHDLTMASSGRIRARGGDGYVIDGVITTGETGENLFNMPTPGGGGSGGSILLQVSGAAVMQGALDTSGGKGGVFDNTPTNQPGLLGKSRGGDGSAGYYRLETPAGPSVGQVGSGIPTATAKNVGKLVDLEFRTASQSRFYSTGSATSPSYLRYVIEATVGGKRKVYSDDASWKDPDFAGVAAPTNPLHFQIQGGKIDVLTGKVLSIGPWREFVFSKTSPSLNDDDVNGWRFRLNYDQTATQVVVKKVTVWYQL